MSIGTVLNNIAIKSNSNHMPIFPDVTYLTGFVRPEMFIETYNHGDFHVLGNHMTRLIPICDIFDNGISIYSIGDLFIFSFAFIIIYNSIKASNK